MTKEDYYNYWNKKRKEDYVRDREKKALSLIRKNANGKESFLDIGCGNGRFLAILKKIHPSMDLNGIDLSKSEVQEAQKRGLNVKMMDIEKGLKYKDNKFDMVYSGEVIEHLYNPDSFLSEINRVLKNRGILVLTTPNLCAWFNRILMPLGIQPLFLEPSTKSKLVGAGILKRLKKESAPVGHVRIFTFEALKDMLKMNGFRIECVKGAVFDDGFPKPILAIDRIFNIYPRLSSNFVILARKMR